MTAILTRKEWTPEQRVFLQQNPELAVLCEDLLNHLDNEITYLEKRKQQLGVAIVVVVAIGVGVGVGVGLIT